MLLRNLSLKGCSRSTLFRDFCSLLWICVIVVKIITGYLFHVSKLSLGKIPVRDNILVENECIRNIGTAMAYGDHVACGFVVFDGSLSGCRCACAGIASIGRCPMLMDGSPSGCSCSTLFRDFCSLLWICVIVVKIITCYLFHVP